MTTFLLIRHAMHSHVGRTIVGRMPGVHLSAEGQAQAQRLTERLSSLSLQAVYSSPLERARETAEYVARRFDLPVTIAVELNEIDYGAWSGKTLDELDAIPRWQLYNTFRSGTRIPDGEMMHEAQTRIITFMERLREAHPDDIVALVSHGDMIKAAVAYLLGVPLDMFLRIEISPASVTILEWNVYGSRLLCLNMTDAGP